MRAAHIKQHTVGTSNELSFSVLDAAKRRADAEDGKGEVSQIPDFGKVSTVALPIGLGRKKKKKVSTPTKDSILPLSNGETIVSPSGGTASLDQKPFSGKIGRGAGGSSASAGRGPALGTPTVQSSPFNKPFGQAGSSSGDEIERRKSKRRRRHTSTVLIATVVVACLLGAGGYLIYTMVTTHNQQVSLLQQALAQIEEADKVVVPVDELVNNTEGDPDPDTVSSLLDSIPDTYKKLDAAYDLASQASENMRDSSEKDAADQALASVDARRAMLDTGATLLQAEVDALNATDAMTQAWDKVLQADSLAREAASMVTDTTNDNVTASKEKSQQALDLFNDALTLITDVSNSSLEPDVQVFLDYVGKRVDAMNCAIASDDAILAQDRQTAEDQNTAYNTKEDEAAQLARQLPSDVTSPISSAYAAATDDPMKTYAEARHQASTADAFLRDYLGT
ncbi:MAG: hypothetical protein FWD72_00085 [Eggerthellaceae bacterium]|nr:hypothetical protein [Eggerthellaceae bacterium]